MVVVVVVVEVVVVVKKSKAISVPGRGGLSGQGSHIF
jgi:hypothetical protein